MAFDPNPLVRLPPPGMRVTVDHDGITWQFGRRLDWAGVGALVAGITGLGGIVGVASGAREAVAGLVVSAIAGWVAVHTLRSTTVRLTHRAVTLQVKAPWGSHRQDLRIDDLTDAGCARSDRDDLALVLRTAQETVVVGSREPEAHLQWMLDAVEHARAATARREAAEGREWGFLRKAPEALDRLR